MVPSSNVTSLSLLHPENALSRILLTLDGIVILVRLLQFLKAYSPILVTPSGIVMLVMLLQFSNAFFPILSTFTLLYSFGIIISLSVHSPIPVTSSSLYPNNDTILYCNPLDDFVSSVTCISSSIVPILIFFISLPPSSGFL